MEVKKPQPCVAGRLAQLGFFLFFFDLFSQFILMIRF